MSSADPALFVSSEGVLAQRIAEHKSDRKDAQKIKRGLDASSTATGDTLPIPPTAPAARLTYGAYEPARPTMTEAELLHDNPEEYASVARVPRAEFEAANRLVVAASGLPNVAQHLLPNSAFQRKPVGELAVLAAGTKPHQKKASVRAASERVARHRHNHHVAPLTDVALAPGATLAPSLADALPLKAKKTEKTKKTKTNPPPKKRARSKGGSDTPATAPAKKRARASDAPAAFGGKPSKAAEKAVARVQATRDMTQMEVDAILDFPKSKATKSVLAKSKKPLRYEHSVPNEAALAGNESVRATHRSQLSDGRLLAEAERATDPTTAHTAGPLDPARGLPKDGDAMDVETPVSLAIETRPPEQLTVVQHPPMPAHQRALQTAGDQYSAELAAARRRPATLPARPIATPRERELEQGRAEVSRELRNHALDRELEGLAPHAFPVDPDARIQPLVHWVKRTGTATRAATLGMKEQLVFDHQRRIERGLPTTIHKYIEATTNPALAETDPAGRKRVLVNFGHLAQRLRGNRENAGRLGRRTPTRLMQAAVDLSARYLIACWNGEDKMFRNDRPAFERGQVLLASPVHALRDVILPNRRAPRDPTLTLAEQQEETEDATQAQSLLRACEYGPIGQIHARVLGGLDLQTELVEDTVGLERMIAAADLGTDRLHPDANPLLPRVTMRYHLQFMRQPREGERECIRGADCYCYTSNTTSTSHNTYGSATSMVGFVAVEFLLPVDYERFVLHGPSALPEKRRRCLLCYLLHVTRTMYGALRDGKIPTRAIHDHCVEFDTEGQYASRDLCPVAFKRADRTHIPSGIVDAFPQFDDSAYFHDVIELEGSGKKIRVMRYHPSKAGF